MWTATRCMPLSVKFRRKFVLLEHASGHMSFANAEAMRLAEVTAATSPPPAAKSRDSAGNPIGVFRETAQNLIGRAHAAAERNCSPEDRRRDLLKAIDLATDECLKKESPAFRMRGRRSERWMCFANWLTRAN